jgi:hypothetical protein
VAGERDGPDATPAPAIPPAGVFTVEPSPLRTVAVGDWQGFDDYRRPTPRADVRPWFAGPTTLVASTEVITLDKWLWTWPQPDRTRHPINPASGGKLPDYVAPTPDRVDVVPPTLGAAGAIFGDSNTAVTFGGTNHVVGSTGAIVGAATTWTVEAWLKTSAAFASQGRPIYCERAASGNDILKLECLEVSAPTQAMITYRNDGGTLLRVRGVTTVNDGAWHHIVAVRNGSAVTLYVDGASDATGTWSGSNTFTNPVEAWIGQDKGDGIANLIGTADEVAVYTAALTGAQILANYNRGKFGT